MLHISDDQAHLSAQMQKKARLSLVLNTAAIREKVLQCTSHFNIELTGRSENKKDFLTSSIVTWITGTVQVNSGIAMKKINLDNQAVRKALSAFLFLSGVFLLLFFRNPRLFIYPEPWAEDMRIFLSQEYDTGFPEPAFTLYAGYIHLLPRIIAWISVG